MKCVKVYVELFESEVRKGIRRTLFESEVRKGERRTLKVKSDTV